MELDTSLRVLVVEDNPNLRKVLVNIIKKLGFADVLEGEDGQDAWEQIQAGGVGLILTDWNMPRMDGLELLQKVRGAKDETSKLPFLMITAADTKSAILSAGKHGVDAYIIKPFSVATISEKIQEAFANRAAP